MCKSRWLINITLEINTDRIRKNLVDIKENIGVKVMLMLKANAYGHGLLQVANATKDVADMFGVETLEEGIALKDAGIDNQILALAIQPCEVEDAIRCGLTIGVHNLQIAQKIALMQKSGYSAKTHIKVDSGMHRLGLDMQALLATLDIFKDSGVEVSGVYSHLRDGTTSQKSEFERLARVVKDAYPHAIAHLVSSHSLFNADMRYDMARVGILAYKGAMRAKSTVIDARFVRKGERIGYGDFCLDKDSNIAVIFGGYADGISRAPSVYIDGRKCEPIGNACMDVFIVDTGKYLAKPSRSVIIFDENTIDDCAREIKTIDYCVMTALHGRVKRCYNA